MVTWEQVRSWDPSAVDRLGQRLTQSWRAWDEMTDDLGNVVPAEWTGEAAAAARDRLADAQRSARCRLESLITIRVCVSDTAMSMFSLVACAYEAAETAQRNNFDVDAAGTVHDRTGAMASASGDAWALVRDRRRMHVELTDRIDEIVRSATELDDNAARVLSNVDVESDRASELRVAPASVPVDAAPSANAAYWQALPQSARTALLVSAPESIGNLDGIPAQVRDTANRRVLAGERTRLLAEQEALRRELESNRFGGWFSNADEGLEQTTKRIESLDALTATLEQGDRQLLVFDNSSYEETMAAVAVGNVDTATHVAVFVPGLSSTVHGNVQRYDGSMDDLKRTVEQQLSTPDETVACVTWMDYRAPQLGWDLVDPDRSVIGLGAADAGATRLAGFLNGLDAMRATDPHLALLGHSYGSLTAATALSYDTGVDDFVAMGSPGLGLSEVSSMSVPAGHTFIAEASGDTVADLGAFGPDPSGLDGVTALATDGVGTLRPSEGHSGYLDVGTVGQEGTAAVVAGRPPPH